jgi:hypothetical protein
MAAEAAICWRSACRVICSATCSVELMCLDQATSRSTERILYVTLNGARCTFWKERENSVQH